MELRWNNQSRPSLKPIVSVLFWISFCTCSTTQQTSVCSIQLTRHFALILLPTSNTVREYHCYPHNTGREYLCYPHSTGREYLCYPHNAGREYLYYPLHVLNSIIMCFICKAPIQNLLYQVLWQTDKEIDKIMRRKTKKACVIKD